MAEFVAAVRGISLPLLLMSGLSGYIVSSWMLLLFRVTGATSYSPRIYWACAMFGGLGGGALFAGRVVRVISLAALVPVIYAAIFEIVGNAELHLGAMLGTAHGVLVGLSLPLTTRRHGCARAPAPGLFGWRLGAATPLLLLFVYAIYGAALGYVYVSASP